MRPLCDWGVCLVAWVVVGKLVCGELIKHSVTNLSAAATQHITCPGTTCSDLRTSQFLPLHNLVVKQACNKKKQIYGTQLYFYTHVFQSLKLFHCPPKWVGISVRTASLFERVCETFGISSPIFFRHLIYHRQYSLGTWYMHTDNK